MSGDETPAPALWGKRPFADVAARDYLNDISERIARKQPDHIADPGDLSLSDVLREKYRQDTGDDAQAVTLSEMMKHGLSFEEVVCWYFYRFAGFDAAEIHSAVHGQELSDDPAHRRNSLRNIQRILNSAASKLPGEDPADVPDVTDADAKPKPAAQG